MGANVTVGTEAADFGFGVVLGLGFGVEPTVLSTLPLPAVAPPELDPPENPIEISVSDEPAADAEAKSRPGTTGARGPKPGAPEATVTGVTLGVAAPGAEWAFDPDVAPSADGAPLPSTKGIDPSASTLLLGSAFGSVDDSASAAPPASDAS